MMKLTDDLTSDTMDEEPVHECEIACVYLINGKVVTKMLHFSVTERKFNEQYQNSAVHDLGVR